QFRSTKDSRYGWMRNGGHVTEFIESLLTDVAEEQNPIMFIVWLDTRVST
ncbi:MAG: hypothetical protein FD126_2893, partial [Elusimicrobia bacterium]